MVTKRGTEMDTGPESSTVAFFVPNIQGLKAVNGPRIVSQGVEEQPEQGGISIFRESPYEHPGQPPRA